MMNIKDRVLSHNTPKAALHMDDRLIPTNEDDRLIDMREKFIKSVYQLLKSKDFKDLYIKHGEQIDAKISIKHDAIEIDY